MRSVKRVATCIAFLALALPLTAAAPLPSAKPGLWVIEQHSGNRLFQSRFCDDDASQAIMLQSSVGVSPAICGNNNIAVDGNQVTINAVCVIASSLLVSKTVITYSDDSTFTVVSDGTYAPAFMGKSEAHATMAGHWAGTCPFGFSPGDTVGPTGLRTRFFPRG